MILNRQVLLDASRDFKLLFQGGMAQAKPLWPNIATESPSSTFAETYGWLKDLPSMREWLGSRVVHNLAASSYTLINRPFELTVSVPRENFEDDRLGVFRIPFLNLGESVAMSPDQLIWAMLLNGWNTPCYDGKAYFAEDHPVGNSSLGNTLALPLANLTDNPAEIGDNFGQAFTKISTFTNDTGQPLGIIPSHLFYGPTNFAAANRILRSEYLSPGVKNPYFNIAEPVMVPWFGISPIWILACCSRVVKPVILQRRKNPEFVMKNALTDDNVFFDKEFVYGADDRKNVGVSLWQLAVGSTGIVPQAAKRSEAAKK